MRCSLTASLDVPEAAIASATRELEVFAAMNRGPGFVDWLDVDPRGRVEITAAMLLGQNGGCTSYAQARLAAMRFHDRLAEIVEEGRRAAELGDRRALDLAALVPVPRTVLLRGYGGGGRDWLLANWSVEVPVSFAQGTAVTCRPAPRKGGRPRKGALPLVRVAKEWSFSAEPGFPGAWLAQVRQLYPRLVAYGGGQRGSGRSCARCGGYRLRVPQDGGPSPDAGERTMSGMPSTQYAFPPVLYDKSRP